MVYKDKDKKIYEFFKREYYWNNLDARWGDFIDRKDLGIKVKDLDAFELTEYIIIDEQKWLLSKIKYDI